MALITCGGILTTVRRNGVSRTLRAVDFPAGGLDADRELAVKTALEAALNCAVFIHIYTRSPLAFSIRLAPLGHIPPANWWAWSLGI